MTVAIASHKIGIASGRCEVNLRQRRVDLRDNYKYSLPETAIAKVSGGPESRKRATRLRSPGHPDPGRCHRPPHRCHLDRRL